VEQDPDVTRGDEVAVAESPDAALGEFLADPGNAALDLTTAVARCTKALGLQHSVVYLADLQQRQLTPLHDLVPALPIDDSLAGWTYRTQSLRVEESGLGGMTAWLPLVDGAERLGVLAVLSPALDQGRRAASDRLSQGAQSSRRKDIVSMGPGTRVTHQPAEEGRAL
jgi:hypothetical protein